MCICSPASPEMPGVSDSPELFLVLVVYYGITSDTGKTTGKWYLMRAYLVNENEIIP